MKIINLESEALWELFINVLMMIANALKYVRNSTIKIKVIILIKFIYFYFSSKQNILSINFIDNFLKYINKLKIYIFIYF